MTSLVFNVERVGWQALRGQRMHDQRQGGDLSHIDHERTHQNKVLIGSGDCVQDVKALIDKKGAKYRKDNEKPFNRFVLSASPDHLKDPAAMKAWAIKSMRWLLSEYGQGLAYAVLHMDEQTPHIHAVAVPLYKAKRGWKISHHQHPATKGKDSYARMRKRAADATGLDYGEPGGKPKAKALADAEHEAGRIKASAKREAEETRARAFGDAQRILGAARQLESEAKAKSAAAAREMRQALILGAALKKEAEQLGQVQAAKRIAEHTRAARPTRRRNEPR